ncbi:16S ribosomal RNA methyltransferase RsmE [Caballeronia terrestris]|jgi:16S rRNA (uracil1498-N3)-methyltransferase|uniref:Ribosomal RNA small subunit methyltransferase E n=1 Tax=Caballeronia terrestris TaxID=1226301 RepID=A0A158FF58_9BURK|nr:16S rRNA (uracil(1498)-N(3))-methyltransferase [Caballeronia terrestris]SAL18566.1 16S ribosomal RNA methyltransferase RsmE [Caballeronia terrestris]
MPRFFVDRPLVAGETLPLPDDVVRHVHVLRLQTGDAITLFDGAGGEFDAELTDIAKRAAVARIGGHHDREAEPPYRVTLAQGVAGGDKMDWLIEKAVELGVAALVPLTAERGVVRLAGERALKRQAHWQALVRAACEQCGRNRVPEVAPPRDLDAWLSGMPPAVDGEMRLLLSPRAEVSFASLPSAPPIDPVTVLIGPEAGFSPSEEKYIVDAGFTTLGLGPRVLRTETAGIAVLAALAARWGGW